MLFMIEWHVVDAWMGDAARQGLQFTALALIGGLAAPLFLFLAGVAIPFAAASQLRKARSGLDPASIEAVRAAARAVQKRGWQVFLIAHVFRLQSFLWNPWARWDSVFKPDILNILGLGMVLTAWCWGRSSRLTHRIAWLLMPAGVVMLLAPLSRGWWWPSLLQARLEAYIRPNGWGQFTLFPWIAFVLVGAVVGVWIGQARPAERERRFHGRLALAGAAIIIAGIIDAYVPSPFAHSTFWTTSLSFFLIRTGAMTMALSGAWWWMSRANANRWSPVVLFGQTSLFVYVVHVELAYGILSAAWKKSLTLSETAAAYVAFTALMVWAAHWWARRTASGPWVPEHMRA